MSLFVNAEKLNTANTLNSWNNQAIQAMTTAKDMFIKIATQKAAMESNTEYTSEEVAEVVKMLEALTVQANSLISE